MVVPVQKKSQLALHAAADRRPDIADTVILNPLGFNHKLMPEKKTALVRERGLAEARDPMILLRERVRTNLLPALEI